MTLDNMKVEITENEAKNIQTALMVTAKQPNVDVSVMKILLGLSDKFAIKSSSEKDK